MSLDSGSVISMPKIPISCAVNQPFQQSHSDYLNPLPSTGRAFNLTIGKHKNSQGGFMRSGIATIVLLIFSSGAIFACSTSRTYEESHLTEQGELRTPAAALPTTTRAGLDGWLSPQDNRERWGEYCIGEVDDPSVIPQPRYENSFIKDRVLPKLRQIGDKSYYLYGEVLEVYGLRKDKKLATPAYALPEGISPMANAFLVYLCGEFRDRATMVEAKLKWISQIYKLPITPQKKSIDLRVSPFSQLSAEGYQNYMDLSASVFSHRESLAAKKPVRIETEEIESATEAFDICTVKYMMSEYIAKGKSYDDQFESGLSTWIEKKNSADGQPNCLKEDFEYIYDFRGDSNFKPNSPESNAMIWAATSIAKMCETPVTAKSGQTSVTDQDCRDYYTKPFETRWTKARQGLATWLFYPDEHAEKFNDTKQMIAIYPNAKPPIEGGPLRYDFTLQSSDPKGDVNPAWIDGSSAFLKDGSLGFNKVFGTGNAKAYDRIRQLVDRHTDWYASGYDDQRGFVKKDSYSPFVASSYEPSKSDAFIACGYTIDCRPDSDTRKQWMFVFKIAKKNWYRTQDLARNSHVDFSTMWLDESSFGITSLADEENAFDHLGTALELEYDSIMYVHNINGRQGNPPNAIAEDGLPGDNPYFALKNAASCNYKPEVCKRTAGREEVRRRYTYNKDHVAQEVLLTFERPKSIERELLKEDKKEEFKKALLELFYEHVAQHVLETEIFIEAVESELGVEVDRDRDRRRRGPADLIKARLRFKPDYDVDDLVEALKSVKIRVRKTEILK